MPPPGQRPIISSGPTTARIVICGEALGKWEPIRGYPFAGPAGQRLNEWLVEAGINRRECFITNLYPYQPLKNDMSTVPPDEITYWTDQLHDRIASLDDPWVLVPTGNWALQALTGKRNILNHRGSIYEYVDRNGRPIKVIPTLHPASTLEGRSPEHEPRCKLDWKRIAKDSQFRETRLPVRELHVNPTWNDLSLLQADAGRADIIGVDIETPKERTTERVERTLKSGKVSVTHKKVIGKSRITVISFALSPTLSIAVPTLPSYWGSMKKTLAAWEVIREICASPIRKVLQNGFSFDAWWLAQPEYDSPLSEYLYDTRWMHHVIDPLESHSLEYMTSVFTREPYYKNEGKTDDGFADPYDFTEFQRYCARDSAVTVELLDILEPRIVRAGKWDFYLDSYHALFAPLLDMSLRGVRIDDHARRTANSRWAEEDKGLMEQLTKIAGESLYAKKDLSPVKLVKFLYETLGLPKKMKARKSKHGTKTKTVTADEVTVRRLMLEHPDKMNGPGALILRHRELAKAISSMNDNVVDADGRARCSYGLADTLRLTSYKNPRRTGRNLQNIERSKAMRSQFLPEPGRIFLEFDESQAESRVVYMLTEDGRLIEIARSKPWEFDDHKRIASIIFQTEPGLITRDQRSIGKTANHASNYDEKGHTMADTLLKEGVIRTPEECQMYINRRLEVDTGIVRWHRSVRERALRDRKMRNTWGYEIDIRHQRLNDKLYRRLYAWEPQCCDDKTEVLTDRGWIAFPDIKSDNSVAQFDPNDSSITFTRPSQIYISDYDGDMIAITGNRISQVVTPGHRVLRDDGAWSYARDLIGSSCHIPVSGKLGAGTAWLSDACARLLAATQADGSLKNGRVEWHLSKPRKIERLRELLHEAGVRANENRGADGTVTFVAWGAWRAVVDTWLPNKQFTMKLLRLPSHARGALIRETGLWDGDRVSRGGPSWSFATTDLDSASALQALGVLHGYRCVLRKVKDSHGNHKAQWRLNMFLKKSSMASSVTTVPYTGKVYCVTVPTGYFVIRRDGMVSITGNSTVGMLINMWGLIPLDTYLREHNMESVISLQTHDSLTVSAVPDEAYEIACFLQQSLERPRKYGPKQIEMTIPIEMKLGTTLAMNHEFKKFPSRDDFMDVVTELAKDLR